MTRASMNEAGALTRPGQYGYSSRVLRRFENDLDVSSPIRGSSIDFIRTLWEVRTLELGATDMKRLHDDLDLAQYTQAEVLRVVKGLRPKTLQNWNDRDLVQIREANPGRQGKRLYSQTDIVKLAIMSRMSELNIPLIVSRAIADTTTLTFSKKAISWDLHLFLKPQNMEKLLAIVEGGENIPIGLLGLQMQDARYLRVSDFTGTVHPSSQAKLGKPMTFTDANGRSTGGTVSIVSGGEQKIDQVYRLEMARKGRHAEPIIVFPLGEIVNGTLAQLRVQDGLFASDEKSSHVKSGRSIAADRERR